MIANTTDPLATALGVSPMVIETREVLIPVSNNAITDIEYARTNLYDLLENGHSMLNDMLQIAQQAQSAKMYEVVTGLIRTMAQTNLDLVELQQKKKSLTEGDGPRVVNNNLTLTTNDLIRLIKNSGKTE